MIESEEDSLAIELLSLGFKLALAVLAMRKGKLALAVRALGQGKHGSTFQPLPRGAVNKDPRGTWRFQEREERCSFLFAPGSCLRVSTNGFSLQHSHSNNSHWFLLWFFEYSKNQIHDAHSKMPAIVR